MERECSIFVTLRLISSCLHSRSKADLNKYLQEVCYGCEKNIVKKTIDIKYLSSADFNKEGIAEETYNLYFTIPDGNLVDLRELGNHLILKNVQYLRFMF